MMRSKVASSKFSANSRLVSRRNIEIDRLRALAVLVTIYAHLDFIMLGDATWYTASKGWINPFAGVLLFFAISGYVISQSLIPELDRSEKKNEALVAFWTKRLTRITPMAVLWVVVPLSLSFWFNSRGIFSSPADNVPGAIAATFYYFNIFATFFNQKSMFGVYWTLSLEEQFYAIFPLFLLAFATTRSRKTALIIAALGAAMIPAWAMQFRMDAIIYGVFLYLITNRAIRTPAPAPKWAAVAATLCLGIGLVVFQSFALIYLPAWAEPPLSALLAVLLVSLAVRECGFIVSMGRWPDAVLNWIGTRSFGLYLIHIPAFMLAGEITWRLQLFDNVAGRALIASVVMLAVTEICYRAYEVPIRKWGRKLALGIGPRVASDNLGDEALGKRLPV
jgi:peptidoglycan/LPS O-acetylase OafA/YrhL